MLWKRSAGHEKAVQTSAHARSCSRVDREAKPRISSLRYVALRFQSLYPSSRSDERGAALQDRLLDSSLRDPAPSLSLTAELECPESVSRAPRSSSDALSPRSTRDVVRTDAGSRHGLTGSTGRIIRSCDRHGREANGGRRDGRRATDGSQRNGRGSAGCFDLHGAYSRRLEAEYRVLRSLSMDASSKLDGYGAVRHIPFASDAERSGRTLVDQSHPSQRTRDCRTLAHRAFERSITMPDARSGSTRPARTTHSSSTIARLQAALAS